MTVVSTDRLAPRARRVEFEGGLVEDSSLPGAYLSIWFSDPEGAAPRTGRSDKRTMTVRFWDPSAHRLTVDFVLHGSGPASTWAAQAGLGDVVWAGPTRGGYPPPPPGSFLVMIGDDTAIPAIGAIAEALDPQTRTLAVIEVVDEADERAISAERTIDPIWLHRGPDPAETGQLAAKLLQEIEVPDGSHWWIAGERSAALGMRDRLIEVRGVERDRYDINAHWRLTAADPRTT
jgi:NADPH-dependent ferric siderophore reductase